MWNRSGLILSFAKFIFQIFLTFVFARPGSLWWFGPPIGFSGSAQLQHGGPYFACIKQIVSPENRFPDCSLFTNRDTVLCVW